MIRRFLSAYRFSLKRSLRVSLVLWSLGLTLFPPVLIGLNRYVEEGEPQVALYGILLFVLIPGVVCVMSLLLQVVTAVRSELENSTWPYFLTRPKGELYLLAGRVATALTITISMGTVSLVLSLIVSGVDHKQSIGGLLLILIILSSLSFSSVFLFIGSLFPGRAMSISILYVFILEGLASFFPALLDRITISYRLVNIFGWGLFDQIMEEELELPEFFQVLDMSSPVYHASMLLILSTVLFVATGLVLRWKELILYEDE